MTGSIAAPWISASCAIAAARISRVSRIGSGWRGGFSGAWSRSFVEPEVYFDLSGDLPQMIQDLLDAFMQPEFEHSGDVMRQVKPFQLIDLLERRQGRPLALVQIAQIVAHLAHAERQTARHPPVEHQKFGDLPGAAAGTVFHPETTPRRDRPQDRLPLHIVQ